VQKLYNNILFSLHATAGELRVSVSISNVLRKQCLEHQVNKLTV